jgi:hypothetical protein
MGRRVWTCPLGVCLLLLTAGCGSSAISTVSGNVLIDGEPLDGGVISFVPADSTGAPVTVNVVQGKYELQVAPGKKSVQISAPIVVGKRKEYDGPDAPLVEITEERLPPRYHSETQLTFEVAAGRNTKDWSVESIRAAAKKPKGGKS